jgi:hypothetical protein
MRCGATKSGPAGHSCRAVLLREQHAGCHTEEIVNVRGEGLGRNFRLVTLCARKNVTAVAPKP